MASAQPLHANWLPAHSSAYRRPGGPWDIAPLNEVFPARTPHDEVVVDGAVRIEAHAWDSLVPALAGGLRSLGVRRGHTVAWQLPNWHEAMLLFHACWRIGAVAAPMPHRLGSAEVAAGLAATRPTVTFSAPGLPLTDGPPSVAVRGDGAFEALLESRPAPAVRLHPANLAVVVLTSGSTGSPKAVLHTHRALAYKAFVQARVHGLGAHDAVLMPAPLGHVSGLLNGVLLPAAAAMKTVLLDAWDPARALTLIEHEQVSYMGGPSTFLTSMAASPEFAPGRVASLRVASMGGSAMTPSAITELGAQLGCTVKRTYGCSEAPTVTTLHEGDPPVKGAETDGRPVGEVQVRIADATTLRPLTAGEVGEVWLRGPELFAGYADVVDTRAVTHRGWLRTGDLGRLDAEGWLTIVGRIKELIIRGGENIATAEVETVLEAHPAVTRAVAVGLPDPVLGERVAVVIVADPAFDVAACRVWFAERGVAKYKTPEVVVHVDEIPHTHVGKPDGAALRTLVQHASRGASWT